jgi:hypothetical protein
MMKTKRILVFLVILILMTAITMGASHFSRKNGGMPGTSLILDTGTFLWVNSILCIVYNNGNFGYDEAGFLGKTDGFYFPFSSEKDNKTVIYSAGIWVGAKVDNDIRVAVAEYTSEFKQGAIEDGLATADRGSYKVYKVGDGYELDGKTPYDDSGDRTSWPIEQGAPVDEFDEPAILGDQMCWSVYNDADPSSHTRMLSDPLGIEVKQSTFGFAASGPLDNVIFLKYEITNKGENRLDSTYISLWADPDVGDATDDFVGCDTLLSLGFAYNNGEDGDYGLAAPAVGFDFFQGPLIESPGDSAVLPDRVAHDTIQLGMTSFNKYINGTDPHNPSAVYNYMRGLNRDGTPVIDENTGEETKYFVPGDPVTGEGWIDVQAGDRRWMMSTGPFTMMPGETQIIVAAALVGQGTDPVNSIEELKRIDQSAQTVYDLNFVIPLPPDNPTVYARGYENYVELVWSDDVEGPGAYLQDFREELGQMYCFEGYNVYFGQSATGPWTKIATFDYDAAEMYNAYGSVIGDYVDCDVDLETGDYDCSSGEIERIWDFALLYEDVAKERVIGQEGSNSGLEHQLIVSRDPTTGSPLEAYMPYYFAVTAYGVNVEQVGLKDSVFFGPNYAGMLSYTLESKIRPVTVTPYGTSGTLGKNATHVSGVSDGYVEVEFLVQDSVNGHEYEVTFNEDGTWNLRDMTDDEFVLESQANQSGDFRYPLVNGFMPRVVGPVLGFNTEDVYHSEYSAGEDESELALDYTSAYMDGRNASTNDDFRDFVIKFIAGPEDTVSGPTYFVEDEGVIDTFTTVRYLDNSGDTIWGYFIGGSREIEEHVKVSVPFAVYDVGGNLMSQDDDARLWPGLYDFYGDYRWHALDYVILFDRYAGNEPYANIYENDFWSYAPHDGDMEYWVFDPENPYSRSDWDYRIEPSDFGVWAKGDSILLVSNNANREEDVFSFVASAPGDGDGDYIAQTMDNILVVPNPYYTWSEYETNQFDRIVKFTQLPGGVPVSIRIFNIAGDHIRTLTREDLDQSWMEWNLKTESGLFVASGMYIWIAESDIGSKHGKMAVFVEAEQLDTF